MFGVCGFTEEIKWFKKNTLNVRNLVKKQEPLTIVMDVWRGIQRKGYAIG